MKTQSERNDSRFDLTFKGQVLINPPSRAIRMSYDVAIFRGLHDAQGRSPKAP